METRPCWQRRRYPPKDPIAEVGRCSAVLVAMSKRRIRRRGSWRGQNLDLGIAEVTFAHRRSPIADLAR